MSWRTRDVEKSLLAKGFLNDRTTDHKYFFLYIDGKKTSVSTKLSHGREPIDKNTPLFKSFKLQLRLTGKELENFFNCPLSFEEYCSILIQNGEIVIETDEDLETIRDIKSVKL